MINEYYIIADGASIKPRVLVWNGEKEEFLPLAVFGIKDHAEIKIQNKQKSGVISNGTIVRISPKVVTKWVEKTDSLFSK